MFKTMIISLMLLFVYMSTGIIILPEDQFMPGWKRDGNKLTFRENDLYGHINGGAELFLEFGFQELNVQNYIKGEEEITIEIYHMSDPGAALGIYLMKKGTETIEESIKARNSTNRYQSIAAKGEYYIQINNFSGREDLLPTLINMSNFILNQITDQPLTIFDILPSDGLIPGSERIIRGPYALQPLYTLGEGNILSLNRETQAVYAEYVSGNANTYNRIQIKYKDIPAARDAFIHLKKNLDAYIQIEKESESSFLFKDYKQKYGQVQLFNRFIEIIFNRQHALPVN